MIELDRDERRFLALREVLRTYVSVEQERRDALDDQTRAAGDLKANGLAKVAQAILEIEHEDPPVQSQ
jgi:hypothetical protein